MSIKNVPKCVGFIMDANRRWARERNLPTLEGHRRGLENLKQIVNTSLDAGVETIILYGFSTENWNRSKEEVAYLMHLFEVAIGEHLKEVIEREGKVQFIGTRDRFPDKLRNLMNKVEEKTKNNSNGTVIVALSYGGRLEIVTAVNKLLKEGVEEVSEEEFSNNLWTAGLPDPDLIIRTGGDQRLSNFLTWQSSYSELHFTKTYWPAFGKEELLSILEEYSTRERRFGK